MSFLPEEHSLPDGQNSKQPLSLLTIDSSSAIRKRKILRNLKEELLTIRILEASERKVNLLKKLLTPDQYKSIESELLAVSDFHDVFTDPSTEGDNQGHRRSSLGAGESHFAFAHDANLIENSKRQSTKSDHIQFAPTNTSVRDNLRRKREAIEFFFREGETAAKSAYPNLELRSGYYIGSSSSEAAEKILKYQAPSWYHLIVQFFVSLLSSVCSGFSSRVLLDEAEKHFLKSYSKLNCLPYTREANLLTMKRRLEADGQERRLERAGVTSNGSNKRDFLKLAHNHHSSSLISLGSYGGREFKIVRISGQVNALSLRAPKKVDQISNLELLEYHPLINLLCGSVTRKHEIAQEPDVQLDRLYRKLFQLKHNYDSREQKLSRLLNKCDHGQLLKLIDGDKYAALDSNFLKLDVFLESFREEPEDVVRRALLVWRWVNGLNSAVQLSHTEIVKSYSFQFDSNLLRSKIRSRKFFQKEQGYKWIEQIRSLAIELINDYESQLKETAKLKAERLADESSGPTSARITRSKDVLKEPEIKMMDLSISLSAIRRMLPTKRARRPLMPKRLKAHVKKSPKLANLINEHFGFAEPRDLEARVISSWRNMTLAEQKQRLQVVVTVQQALNVPMRVSYNQPASLARTGSPSFLSPSPTLAGFGFNQQQMAAKLLVPPTTYVEVIFQRRQQATSLSYGKDPAWNETLFFPVDTGGEQEGFLSGASGDANRLQIGQLIDEFLQLNLYDYNCYVVDAPATGNRDELEASKTLRASRQRVERHLLGSLRVPLSSLISSGKIQGCFALNQPMFLDNYHFQPEAASPPMLLTSIEEQRAALRTHMKLFVTIDPAISSICSMASHLFHFPTESHEGERVFELAHLWETLVGQCNFQQQQQQHKQAGSGQRSSGSRRRTAGHHNHRHVRALVLHREAKYCLVSRLLSPLKPPEELLSGEPKHTLRLLARFVSLLSPLKYGLFNGRSLASSVWFDSIQLLNNSLGGFEEKAVLLCNYFLQLGLCSALLLADALPEGRCVLVLVYVDQSSKSASEHQLALEASQLLAAPVAQVNQDSTDDQRQQPPVTQFDFISRLPVMINSKSCQLWDPQTGNSFNLLRPNLLFSIGSIVTCENVYANLQCHANLAETNFDIRSKQLWYPLFELHSMAVAASAAERLPGRLANKTSAGSWRKQLAQLESMKRQLSRPLMSPMLTNETFLLQVDYASFSQAQCDQLKAAIEKNIKASLLKWRPNRPTYFNRTLSRILSERLTLFEGKLVESPQVDWKVELAELIKSEILLIHLTGPPSFAGNTLHGSQQQAQPNRQIVSWPANMSYTNMKSILDSLFASGIHNADLELSDQSQTGYQAGSSQFLLACHVTPYPARLMSVWLYVAAIVTTTVNAAP